MQIKAYIVRYAAPVLAVLCACAGIAVLVSWAVDRPAALCILSNTKPMSPAAALCFILTIGSVLFSYSKINVVRGAGIALSGSVVLLSSVLLVQWLSGSHDIEKLFIAVPGTMHSVIIGRISPISASFFFFIAAAVGAHSVDDVRTRRFVEIIALVILCALSVMLTGYWYGAPLLYSGGTSMPVSFLSALCFFLLSIVLLMRTPDALFSRILNGTTVFASFMRYLIPALVIIMLAGGWHDVVVAGKLPRQMGVIVHALTTLLAVALLTTATIIVSRRAGRKLEESESRLAATLRSIGDGVIATDAKGRVLSLNTAAEAFTGWTTADAFGRMLSDVFVIINGETLLPAENPVDRVLKEGTIIGLANHTALISRDGTERQIADSAAPIRDAVGNIIGTVLVFRDVTESYAMQVKLERSEAQYRQLFSGMISAFALHEIICDGEGKPVDYRFVAVNSAFETMTGLKAENIIGKTVLEVLPATESVWIKNYGHVALSGTSMQFDSYSAALGKHYDVRAYCPKRGMFAVIFQDITDRKRSEQELRQRETMLQCLWKISQFRAKSVQEILDFTLTEAIALSGSTVGYIYHYDEDKKEFTLNSWSRDVMKECRIMDPRTVYQLEKTGIWGEAVRQRKAVIDNDFARPNPLRKGYPEGHVHLDTFMSVPIFSGENIVAVAGVGNKKSGYSDADVRMLSHLMDSTWKIVERFEAMESVRKHEEALMQADKLQSLGVLATGIVHEINQPLMAISMALDILAMKADDSAYTAVKVASMKDYVSRITKIVEQVRTFAREKHDDTGAFSMNTAVRNVLGMIGTQLKGRTIRVIESLDDTLAPLTGDLYRFEQAVLNLVTNARYALEACAVKPEGAEISIRTYSNGRKAVLQIRDNGSGISEDVKRSLFTPFFTTKPVGDGTGLGLSITYGIIKSMGGTIDVVSEEGIFTEFTITLPVR